MDSRKFAFIISMIFMLTASLQMSQPAFADNIRLQPRPASVLHNTPFTSTGTATHGNIFLDGNDFLDFGGIAADASGNIYVTGASSSSWGKPISPHSGDFDGFVAKITPSGNLIWNAFLGGNGYDSAYKIVLDEQGNLYVLGSSKQSWGNPVRQYSGFEDIYVAKLSSSGALIWNTFLGGFAMDNGSAMIIDSNGYLYVAGSSGSHDSSISGAWGNPVRAYTGGFDGFVAKLSPTGNMIWNTFLGDYSYDSVNDIEVNATGDILVVGESRDSWGSPLAYSTGDNSFVARLASSGQLVWNTFLGGENSSGTSLAIKENDEIYVVGYSLYSWGAPLQSHRGHYDIYVARFNEDGSQVWHTFAGSSNNEWPSNALLDKNGDIVISGHGYGRWGNPLRPYIQNLDAVVFKMNSDGNLLWNTFLGGPGEDLGFGIAIDGDGKIYICGSSEILWGEGKKITWMSAPLPEISGYGLPVWEIGHQRLDRPAAEGNFIAASGATNAHYFISDITYVEHATQVNLLQDPSFEAYTPNLYWDETSDNFYTPLCVFEVCGYGGGTAMPRTGRVWAWFGGVPWSQTESASLSQVMLIPSGYDKLNLQFYFWIGATEPASGVNDVFGVKIDDQEVFLANATQQNQYPLYTPVSIDITDFADGNPHKVTFYSQTGALVNFNLDDVAITSATFVDTPLEHWAWGFVERLYNAGITGGCGTAIYCPENIVNRAQMAVFLERGIRGSAFSPPPATGTRFGDVATSHWAAAWIEQLAEDRITGGCSDGNYCPENPVTRAQMAVFLLKSKHGSNYVPPAIGNEGTGFADVADLHWAAPWIKQLATEGITGGCGPGIYCPESPVTRAQMAVFLVRTFNLP